MNVSFEKYHGTGNEFLIIDATERVPDRGELAKRECDRETGVGADGVLFLNLEPDFSPPRVVMTLVQPDGRPAPMCGNGARCAAEWAMERTGTDNVMIDTQAGTLRAERTDDGVAVEMSELTFEPEYVPVEADEPVIEEKIEGLEVTVLNTGVPHAVAFVDDVDAVDLEAVAEPVRNAACFPHGTNVTIASPDPDGAGFRQRTYKRGVEAEIASSGTGAVAIAAAARRIGLTDADTIDVHPSSGRLEVTFDGSDVVLAGPVEHEFDGEISLERGLAST